MKKFKINTKICFCQNSLEQLKELKGKNILVICDSFIANSVIMERVKRILSDTNIEIFDSIVPDPPVEVVAMGIEKMKEKNVDTIIALGGGSSIDGAKAIKEYYLQMNGRKNIEFYAIPTTSGTGSEVTKYAIITDKKAGIKYPLISESLLPDVAILDVELLKNIPLGLTIDTAMDALTHAIEAIVSKGANYYTDAFAEKAISLIWKGLANIKNKDISGEIREKLHIGANMAGIAFNEAGLGLNHGIAHVLGGKYHIPHGRINAILLPHIIKFNSKNEGVMKKYSEIAKRLGILSTTYYIGCSNLVKEIEKIILKFEIPKKIKIDKKLTDDEYEKLIDNIYADVCTNSNPVEISRKDLKSILLEILEI